VAIEKAVQMKIVLLILGTVVVLGDSCFPAGGRLKKICKYVLFMLGPFVPPS
jgi:hypothetical protein